MKNKRKSWLILFFKIFPNYWFKYKKVQIYHEILILSRIKQKPIDQLAKSEFQPHPINDNQIDTSDEIRKKRMERFST